MISSSSQLSAQHIPSANEWHALMNALLANSSFDFKVTETDDSVIINSDNPLVYDKLNTMLSSPELLLSNLWYTMQTASQSSATLVAQTYPLPAKLDSKTIRQIFSTLFDEETKKYLALFDWKTNEEQNLLTNKLPSNKMMLLTLCEEQINLMQACLSAASFYQLRNAISEHPQVSVVDYTDKTLKGPLAPIIERIMGVKKEPGGSILFYFDYGLLYQCLVSPVLTKLGNEIHIPKASFINYLLSVTESGLLLEKTGNNQARPIMFNTLQIQATRPHQHHVLLLDCSSSMALNFDNHIKRVIDFINVLREQSPTADLELIPFGSAEFNSATFKLSQKTQIDAFLTNLAADGLTYIFKTANNALLRLAKQQQDDICMYIFTDGCDTDPVGEVEKVKLETSAKQLVTQSNPPKMYIIGIGEEYDANLAKLLTDATNGVLINAKNASEFDQIYAYLKQISLPREMVSLLGQCMGKLQEERISLYAGQPALSKLTISLPSELKLVRGNVTTTYNISAGAPILQAAPKPDVLPDPIPLAQAVKPAALRLFDKENSVTTESKVSEDNAMPKASSEKPTRCIIS